MVKNWMSVCVLGGSLLAHPAMAGELPSSDSQGVSGVLDILGLDQPTLQTIGRKDKADEDEFQSYRTNYKERALEFGIDGGFTLLNGDTVQAFKPSGSVTPYFDISFGDGNSIVLGATIGYHLFNEENTEYYFFRAPVLPETTADGNLRYVIPTVSYRYENDLTSNLGRRGRAFFSFGVGLGAGVVSSEASIENAGSAGTYSTTYEDTLETFFAIAPSIGFRFRVTEFLFVNITSRYNMLVQFGKPRYLEEGDLEGMRTFDTGMGISYEFGG